MADSNNIENKIAQIDERIEKLNEELENLKEDNKSFTNQKISSMDKAIIDGNLQRILDIKKEKHILNEEKKKFQSLLNDVLSYENNFMGL